MDWNRATIDVTGAGRIPRDQFEEFVADLDSGNRERLVALYVLDEAGEPAYRLRGERLSLRDRNFVAATFGRGARFHASPATPTGGTVRPLGLTFIGLRPDRDLGADTDGRLSTGYLLPFEIISIHLLVVLIGAAYLARAKRRRDAGL